MNHRRRVNDTGRADERGLEGDPAPIAGKALVRGASRASMEAEDRHVPRELAQHVTTDESGRTGDDPHPCDV